MAQTGLQIKFSLSYLCVLLAVLVLMNTYPLVVSEDLVFRAKQGTLQSSVSVMAGTLSELGTLNTENVTAALLPSSGTGLSRVLVSDAAGTILYDTAARQGVDDTLADVVEALRGNDVFRSRFVSDTFRSNAASPVLYRNHIIGAVCICENDAEQGALLSGLQRNLLRISVAVAAAVVVISLFLSQMLTRRFGVLLNAVRRMREGAYSHHAEVKGHDEISQLADEFNLLSDRLQKTEEARRRFVSDASHELKTPLAGIRLMSDSILQTENMDQDTVREFVGDIEQEAERLTRITENLLRLTKLDFALPAEESATEVSPVIYRVVRMLRLVAQERQVEIHIQVDAEKCVSVSEDDLHQIIYNLTENAIKYNRPGGFVRITLGGENECLLTVEDNGIGIPQEDIPRVFDRFYRVDKMRSRQDGGTGLGLSIVADTVRRRAGSIEVQPREGGGTRFAVHLQTKEDAT